MKSTFDWLYCSVILFVWLLCAQSNWWNNQMISIAESITYLDFFIIQWNIVFWVLLKDYHLFLNVFTHTKVLMTRTIWQYEKLKFTLKNNTKTKKIKSEEWKGVERQIVNNTIHLRLQLYFKLNSNIIGNFRFITEKQNY